MEIPSKINFDLLMILLGVGIIIFPFYTKYFDNKLLGLCLTIGVTIILFGLSTAKYSYELDMELREYEFALSKYNYLQSFKKKKMLTKKSIAEYEKEIRKLVNK